MNKKIFILVAFLMFSISCKNSKTDTSTNASPDTKATYTASADSGKDVEPVIAVKVTNPKLRTDKLSIDVQGKVYSKNNVSVSTLAEGKVKKVYFSVGDNVQVGQTIAVLDNKEANNELHGTENKIKINQEIIRSLENKLKDYNEMLKVGIVSRNDVVSILNDINSKKLEIEDLKINTGKLSNRQSNYIIKATASGYLSDIVQEGTYLTLGQSSATIVSDKNEYIEALVPIENIKDISKGIEVSIIDNTNNKIKGIISNISPVATYNMIKTIIKPNSYLSVGEELNIEIPVKKVTGLIIPKSSVIINDGKTSVYKVENDTAKLLEIEIQKDLSDQVIVSKGIRLKDKIIISNADILADSAKVVIKK